jgi:hypothetical protein
MRKWKMYQIIVQSADGTEYLHSLHTYHGECMALLPELRLKWSHVQVLPRVESIVLLDLVSRWK